jgi:hypothetical protein
VIIVAHILTYDEALGAIRETSLENVQNLELLLSAVDDTIRDETGNDWTEDEVIEPQAKLAASLLFANLYDGADLSKYYYQVIVKLTAIARKRAET